MACSCKVYLCCHRNKSSRCVCDRDGLTIAYKIIWKYGGQKRSRITRLIIMRPSHKKTGLPKHSSYFKDYNINDSGARIMYPLHCVGVKWMYLKNKFDIKDVTTKHIPSADIRNDPDMDYSSFTKANRRTMT